MNEQNHFYYGCGVDVGHYLHTERGIRSLGSIILPWDHLDAVLCPGWIDNYRTGPQIEGLAKLHHKDGWTAIAFWDRSVDHRYNSNSVFFWRGEHSFAEMVEEFKRVYPDIFGRFEFEIKEAVN